MRNASGRFILSCAIVVALMPLGVAISVEASAPHEKRDRVIVDESGRELTLFRAYADGIVFTDPVKLVVRDEDARTLAETEYGRDLSILCGRTRPCIIYRYDGLMPIFPTHTWRLVDGQLRPEQSAELTALGIVAPLWTHWRGYILAGTLLALPAFALWSLCPAPGSRWRLAVVMVAALGGVPYVCIWIHMVVFVSDLSLPWAAVVALAVGGLLYAQARATGERIFGRELRVAIRR